MHRGCYFILGIILHKLFLVRDTIFRIFDLSVWLDLALRLILSEVKNRYAAGITVITS